MELNTGISRQNPLACVIWEVRIHRILMVSFALKSYESRKNLNAQKQCEFLIKPFCTFSLVQEQLALLGSILEKKLFMCLFLCALKMSSLSHTEVYSWYK